MHLPIDVVSLEGRPLEPKKNANTFIHQCGVVVRDNVPISIQEWQKQKVEGVSYVRDKMKEVLWNKLIAHFTLPVFDTPQETKVCSDAVQHYSLKKMAKQFNNYKKRLSAQYLDKVEEDPEYTPDFTGTLKLQRGHWDLRKQKKPRKGRERIRKMHRKRYITIRWGHVATEVLSLSGINRRPRCVQKGSFQLETPGTLG